MAFNTGGHIVTDNLLVMLDASNPRSYQSGTRIYNLNSGYSDFYNYNGPGASGSVPTERIVFDGSTEYAQYTTTPSTLQGDPDFTVFSACYRTSDFLSGGSWGFGNDTTLNGFCNWNYNAGDNNRITIDLWGTSTYSTEVQYPENDWVLVHWTKNAGTFTTGSCAIWVNDTKYTGNDLTTLRGGAGTPSIGTEGMGIGRISHDRDQYYAPIDIGFWAIWDRVLTDTEIMQNFQAKRTRFGI